MARRLTFVDPGFQLDVYTDTDLLGGRGGTRGRRFSFVSFGSFVTCVRFVRCESFVSFDSSVSFVSCVRVVMWMAGFGSLLRFVSFVGWIQLCQSCPIRAACSKAINAQQHWVADTRGPHSSVLCGPRRCRYGCLASPRVLHTPHSTFLKATSPSCAVLCTPNSEFVQGVPSISIFHANSRASDTSIYQMPRQNSERSRVSPHGCCGLGLRAWITIQIVNESYLARKTPKMRNRYEDATWSFVIVCVAKALCLTVVGACCFAGSSMDVRLQALGPTYPIFPYILQMLPKDSTIMHKVLTDAYAAQAIMYLMLRSGCSSGKSNCRREPMRKRL
ncbi:hypothetical protein COCSUDRAFT_45668 [Coccomyxa subellipsoidea C-169]|uniref:Uncharacterized protein n=1 Tax=Coccomyxa subellipsoidea (strain C-169) TaxID=574566 RepID=I0YI20_COCSC|nr:hypothetical protein COCSUDRAFT_45668 [Coccomyxa subellipsoidea C-169]EIE18039.1 hypothetical protein COCSUDRAFT_45668 [Coccomyxa subellipsoidea C-169]|eukprot:XP_005642583.1 hypothetical protein COCSUDRAFT_45668 [Coccomyxa subellipsoidea C-169]